MAEYFLIFKPDILEKHWWKKVNLNFSSAEVESLTKVFMYGSYIRARSLVGNISIEEVIRNELSLYPYTKKLQLQARNINIK